MIQIFRALSIIAVVMIHTTPSGEWQVFCRPFINFSVATFLFLSGYLTKIENDNWFAFCKKRIIRVIIPYIIWTIFYTLPPIFSGDGILVIVKNLITAKATVAMYYIFVYIQFVLLTPWLAQLAKSKHRHWGWLIAPISMIIFKYSGLLTGIEPNAYVSLLWSDVCLGWFTYYYLGLLLGNRIIKPDYSLKTLILLYLVSILLQMAEGYGWLLLGEANCGTQVKLTSFLTSTLFLLIVYTLLNKPDIDVKSKFLRSLGDYSFGIYLCHIMVIMVLRRIPYYTTLSYPFTSFMVVLISWGCCYIGNKICGKKISGWLGLK
ncbi:MAG: acyltransferase [Parabacteroides sp.]|nr:acyltransferase [Parabacteroides sp.]